MNKLIHGNSLNYFEIKSNLNIKLVFTSPSYYTEQLTRNKKEGEIGIGETKEEYISLITKIFEGIYKNMIDRGICVLVMGTYNDKPIKYLIYSLEESFKKIGFQLLNFKEFSKNNSEAILIFSKGKVNINFEIPNFDNIQEYKREGFYGTISTKILNWAIESYSKPRDLVVDPFAGIGTTLLQAKKLNRNYLGVEIDEKFVEYGNNLLKKHT